MIRQAFYTIPAGQPFAEDLARGVMLLCPDPVKLAKATILLPSQRTVKTTRDAFLSVLDGKAALLPQMRALGDLDSEMSEFMRLTTGMGSEIPPAISPLDRHFLLAAQIRKFPIGGALPSAAQALSLAESLASLIDQLHGAGTKLSELQTILPDDLAQHWQDIYKFLQIVMQFWPDLLAGRGEIDPADRQMRLLQMQIAIWSDTPPEDLVVLAGSTGSLQGTRDMMQLISSLPNGMVVFPGLEASSDWGGKISEMREDFDVIRHTATHPLSMLSETLEAIGCKVDEIDLWPGCDATTVQKNRPVRKFLTELFRPAEQTARWRRLRELHPEIDHKAVAGLHRMTAANDHEEAALIASLMRETLETPEKTAMLVTPDRGLAQLVMAALSRWGITVDDTAGQPLSDTSTGRFLLLLAELPSAESQILALLNLLKHPLAACGLSRGQFLNKLRQLELHACRGVLQDRSLDGIMPRLKEHADLGVFYKAHIDAIITPFLAACRSGADLPKLAAILAETAERLAATETDPSGAMRLYDGPAGAEAATFLASLEDANTAYQVDIDSLAPALRSLMSRISVRSAHKKHPRLSILGTVEARMQQADRLILSGLNEGVWPPAQSQDFWMNGAARKDLNLPNLYWRAGLAAHDFFMAAAQKEVFLTRANRSNDAPTRPSRFLSRLQAVLTATQLETYVPDEIPARLQACLTADRQGLVVPVDPPAPRPPSEKRPRKFSATEFDKWITDPYAIYAKHILGLKALRPIDEVPGPALRGEIVHSLLADISKSVDTPDLVSKRLLSKWDAQPVITRFWSQRMLEIVDWFIEQHQARSSDMLTLLIEERGEISLHTAFGDFMISARADRIERRLDGQVDVIDFKTGQPPSKAQVSSMRKTQMLVEALIIAKGGFRDVPAGAEIRSLEYWHLEGKPDNGGDRKPVLPDRFDIEEIETHIRSLFEIFSNADTPYLSEPNVRAKPDFSDVRHLARIREWRATEVGDD